MCVAFLAFHHHPLYPVVLLHNRDERFDRQTAPLGPWKDEPGIFGGRDLEKGGTWLGVHQRGRWALVTNVRDPQAYGEEGARSRGLLVTEVLKADQSLEAWGRALKELGGLYPGFNLLFGDERRAFYYTNRGDELRELKAGIHGLSNGGLDDGWPKVRRGCSCFRTLLQGGERLPVSALMRLMADPVRAPDDQLPETGLPLGRERALSAIFVTEQTHSYGTRASTLVTLDRAGAFNLIERAHPADRSPSTTRELSVSPA